MPAQNEQKRYSITEVAKRLQIHPGVLRRWEIDHKLKIQRDSSKARQYTEQDILKLKNIQQKLNSPETIQKQIVKKNLHLLFPAYRRQRIVATTGAMLATGLVFYLAFTYVDFGAINDRVQAVLGTSRGEEARLSINTPGTSGLNQQVAAVLGVRDQEANFVFNVNVPTNLNGDVTIAENLSVPNVNGVTGIDITTQTSLESILNGSGDVVGPLNNLQIATGVITGEDLSDTIDYSGTLNLSGELQADGESGDDGQVLTSTGDGIIWEDPQIDGGDADTLDGLDSTQFLRSDVSDAYTSGTLSFSDATLLDLSAILHDDAAAQGLRLPQNTALTNPSTGEGYIAYDTTDDLTYVFNGTSWVALTGADTSLQQAYETGNTIQMSAAEGDIQITNDALDEILFLDEDTGRVGIGTVTPTTKLDVTGTITGTAFTDGTLSITGGNLTTTGDVESSTGTITTLDGTTLTYTTGNLTTANVTTLDLGTNTITDGNFNGNWTFNSGDVTGIAALGATGTVTFSGLGTGTDNTVVILNGSNQLTTDEIDSRVWGTSLVDYSGTSANFIPLLSDADTITNSVISQSSGNITVGGDLILSDTYTLEVGGLTGIAYNALANSGEGPEEAAISTDNDLYVGGDVEVDGTIYAQNIEGGLNPGFAEGSVVFIDSAGLAQDNANFFWNDSLNRLGIGTSSPTSALDVEGTVTATTFTDGTLSITGGSIDLGSNSISDGNFFGNWSFNNGNISSANNLEAAGIITFAGLGVDIDNTVLILSSADQVATREIDSRVWGSSALVDYSGTNTNYIAKFSDPDTLTQSVIYEIGGEIGIGNTAPTELLSVGSTSQFAVNSTGAITAATGITSSGTIAFSGLGTGTDNTVVILNGSNQLTTDEVDSRVWGTSLVDYSGTSAGYIPLLSDADTITNSSIYETGGNVGIGTTAPGAFKLNVNGDVNIATSSDITLEGETLRATQLGNRTYTEDNFVTDAQTLTASIDALDIALDDVASGSSGIWLDEGTYIYPSTYTSFVIEDGGDVGIGTTNPSAKLHIVPGGANALQIDPYGAASGNTGELRLQELTANGTNYTGFKSPDSLAASLMYELPNTAGSGDYVLTWQTGNVLQWKAVTGIGGAGDITAVGSVISGDAFTDANADDDWLGLGSTAGRIEFDDQATDEVNILDANVGIGTSAPTDTLHVLGDALATAGFHVGVDSTDNLIDDASNGAGSATLYIGNESILASGDIGVTVQGYNANTSVLGQTIEGSEITDGTIEEVDFEVTNSPTDDYILTFDLATGGFTWIDPSTIGGTIDGSGSAGYLPIWSDSDTLGVSSIFETGGEIGIGNTAPTELLSVGTTSQFAVNSTGAITAATGITSSGTITFSGLTTDGVVMVTSGVLSSIAEGSGGGLDADTLDSLDSLQFLRSDTNDNYTAGILTFDAGTTLDVNGNIAIADTSIPFDGASTNFVFTGNFSANTDDFYIEKTSGEVGIGNTAPTALLSVGPASEFTVASTGTITAATGITSSGTITFSGLTTDGVVMVTGGVLSSIAEGSGGGLDADTLDGLDSLQFLRSDTSDNYTSGTLTTDAGTTLDINGDLVVSDTSVAFDGASTNFAFTGDWSVNTDDLFVEKASGEVGIGNTSPDATLDVDGSVNFDLTAGTSVVIDADTADATADALSIDVGTLTNGVDGAYIDLNVTGDTGNDADTFSGINILASNNATDQTTDDNIYGLYIQNLGGTALAGNEYGIYQAGTGWDYGLYIEDVAHFGSTLNLTGTLDLGTNTISDGNFAGDWTFNSGNLSGITALTATTGNLTTLDLGTNTITDGNFNGNWTFNSGDVSGIAALGATGTVTFSGLGTGTDNTVVILNGSNQLTTDEIDSRVWGATLVDYSGTNTNYIAKFSDADTLTQSVIYETGGFLGIGVTDPDEQLEITGRFHLGQTTAPGTVTDKLYNVSGDLFWNGGQLGIQSIFSAENAAVADGDYLEVTHNGATNNIASTGWYNDGTNWIQIDNNNTDSTTDSLNTDLNMYWNMDEASGNRASVSPNATTNGTTLTDNNTVTSQPGKINNAGNFVAANSEFLELAQNARNNTGDIDFTLSTWVKLTSESAGTTGMSIVSKYNDATDRDYWLMYTGDTTDRFRFLLYGAGALVCDAVGTSGSAVETGTWYHIVAWHDATANTCSIQVNNGTVDSAAETGTPGNSTTVFRVGARNTTETDFFDGYIDEIGFWKKVLTAAEINALYNSGQGLTYPFSKGFRILQADNNNVRLYNYTGATQNLSLSVLNGSAAAESPLWTDNGSQISADNYTDFVITDTGLVGIGTTGPDRKLDVFDSSNPQLRLTQVDNSTYADFQMTSAGDLVLNVDGVTSQLVLDNGGNVGIGTTAPLNKLDVVGDNVSQIHISNDGAAGGAYVTSDGTGQILLTGGAEYTGTAITDALAWTARAVKSAAIWTSSGELQFYTDTGLTAGNTFTPTQRMTIDTAGNVGIGDTTPSYTLDVTGTINATTAFRLNGTSINTGGTLTNVAYLDQAQTFSQIQTIDIASGVGDTPFELVSNQSSAAVGPVLNLYRNSGSPAASDLMGDIRFQGNDSNGAKANYSSIRGTIIDATAGSEDGSVLIRNWVNGSITDAFEVSGTRIWAGSFTSSGTAALCWDNTGGSFLNDCSGAPVADYAEIYPTQSSVDYGEIVTTSSQTTTVNRTETDREGNSLEGIPQTISVLEQSSQPYQSNIIGITSRNWADFSSIGHDAVNENDNPLPISLSGRVPVKVSASSDPIKAGDFVTTSNDPGKAMKATQGGYVVGKALEDWSPDSGKETVLVFVSLGYHDPQLALDESGDVSASYLTAEDLTPVNTELATLSDDVSLIKELLGLSGTSETTETSESSSSTTLSGLSGLVEEMLNVYNEFKGFVEALGMHLDEGTNLLNIDANLAVLGDTTLGKTIITDDLNVGLMKLNPMENSIDVLGATCISDATGINTELCNAQALYLQKGLSGNVNIFDGKIVLEPDGTIKTEGNISARGITITTSEAGANTVGTVIIQAGQESQTVQTTALTPKSRVFTTPERPVAVGVEMTDANTFNIVVDPQSADLKVDWWLVNEISESVDTLP